MTGLRRLWFGLATVLGLARRGFFIPYRYAADVAPAGARSPYDEISKILAAHETDFAALLARLDHYADDLSAIGDAPAPAPRWRQDWFPRLDGGAAYVMVRDTRPARIVEVGSGHSTRFLARAVADGGLATKLTAVDPAPRAAIRDLAVQWIPTTLRDAGLGPFQDLAAGDILFIDSSHILMPGSDVDTLFNRILPALPAGVRVHIHDIFLPDDYPAAWQWRGYNEQLAVAALLQGGGYRPLFASHYVVSRMTGAVAATVADRLTLMPGATETSLWLEKT
ncbi:MAG: class I SAM-dependent methyltransferase [Alphaproteobacteria bacterium]